MIRALLSLLVFRVAGAKVMLLLTVLRWLRGRGATRRDLAGRNFAGRGATGRTR